MDALVELPEQQWPIAIVGAYNTATSSGQLAYYADDACEVLKGEFDLVGCTVLQDHYANVPNMLVLTSRTFTLKVQAADDAELRSWLTQLQIEIDSRTYATASVSSAHKRQPARLTDCSRSIPLKMSIERV